MNLVALSVPIFLFLIAIEFVAGLLRQRKVYAFSDFVTNISCGIGQQVLGAFFAILTFAAYRFIYDEWRIFTIPDTWYYALLLFIGVDFFYYWFHRLSHEINAIWATHIVHHQSEEYNLSVALRQSWFQTCFSWVFYIPLSLLGFSPMLMVIIVALNTLYQFWIHTKLIRNMGPFEWIFNTPSHHRVHHGSNPRYIDKNHAGTLIIWDRMFGTFQKEEEEVVYGITVPLRSWNPFHANFHYWQELAAHASKARGMDKVRMFLKSPGWFPADQGGVKHAPEVNAASFKKFGIEVLPRIQWYVFLQFLFTIGAVTYYMFFANDWILGDNFSNLAQCAGLAVFILLTIFSLGALLENRSYGWPVEMLRLVAGMALILLFSQEAWFSGMLLFYPLMQIALLAYVFIPSFLRTQTQTPKTTAKTAAS